MKITILAAWLCLILYLAYDMGFHCLTFTGRNFKKNEEVDVGMNDE